jgi:hypothetical protein
MGVKANSPTIDTAIRNAEASLRMEGLHPSREVLSDCRRVLSGELSHEQYLSNVRMKYMESDYGKVQPRSNIG